MASRIEDYAVIGNRETMALVGRNGSIDWLCLPRFDSDACFAALLGGPEHGMWRIGPADAQARVSRAYRSGTLVLETRFETAEGAAVLIDCMAWRDGVADVVRLVRGERGRLAMRMDLVIRFGYGIEVPWVSRLPGGRLDIVAGPDRLVLSTTAPLRGEAMTTVADFEVAEGQEIPFALSWASSFRARPDSPVAAEVIEDATQTWRAWSGRCSLGGPYADIVGRSLITLRALAHHQTGGIVAAATTSLPEQIGGPRNWDYRFCWLRDATLTLTALMNGGYIEEAQAWRDWLLRAVAGSPEKLQIMYGLGGERRLTEWEVPWLGGYEASAPVRIGNAASDQMQLDVYGEVIDAMYRARTMGMGDIEAAWDVAVAMLRRLGEIWDQPDDGLWETRGGRQHFTHSKVMAWVAFDRMSRGAGQFRKDAPVAQWRAMADRIHADICERGFNKVRNTFTQAYGSSHLDASLLMIPMVGFLPPEDPRVIGTVAAIEHDLLRDGFVLRYDTAESRDGLPPGEGAFLACSFWLADNYVMQGRHEEARVLFERLLGLCNDVGLLAEEYDPRLRRQLGNFPQAFSHVALVNTANNIEAARARMSANRDASETLPGTMGIPPSEPA